MELATQIKQHRSRLGWSQEELAEKAFVSRQTISNWENDKSYPDIQSLLLLSTLFDVSLDQLVKGDVNMMKDQMRKMDAKRMERDSLILGIMFLVMVISGVPLIMNYETVGMVIWGGIVSVNLIYAFYVERQKKKYDIQTYREIVAFINGDTIDEITMAREKKKRPQQTVFKLIGGTIVGIVFSLLSWWLFVR